MFYFCSSGNFCFLFVKNMHNLRKISCKRSLQQQNSLTDFYTQKVEFFRKKITYDLIIVHHLSSCLTRTFLFLLGCFYFYFCYEADMRRKMLQSRIVTDWMKPCRILFLPSRVPFRKYISILYTKMAECVWEVFCSYKRIRLSYKVASWTGDK